MWILLVLLACLPSAAPGRLASDPVFEFEVDRGRTLGSQSGVLRFDDRGVTFRSTRDEEPLAWEYRALKGVRLASPTRIVLDTYEDRGWLALGADRRETFVLRTGVVEAGFVDFLLARIERPVVTAVMPTLGAPLHSVPVKHLQFKEGSHGTLSLHDDGLAYVTERPEASRYWRFRDLLSVLRLDRDRLELQASEDDRRPFTFELKAEPPPGMLDVLWQRVNRAAGRDTAVR